MHGDAAAQMPVEMLKHLKLQIEATCQDVLTMPEASVHFERVQSTCACMALSLGIPRAGLELSIRGFPSESATSPACCRHCADSKKLGRLGRAGGCRRLRYTWGQGSRQRTCSPQSTKEPGGCRIKCNQAGIWATMKWTKKKNALRQTKGQHIYNGKEVPSPPTWRRRPRQKLGPSVLGGC
jgi:hypothetical protein